MAAKGGRGGMTGTKLKMALALPNYALINCADNTGAKNIFVIGTGRISSSLNRIPAASVGDVVLCSVKKGKPDLKKKVLIAVIIRQRKPWRRLDGTFVHFQDNAGVIITNKGEMKGSIITGPVAKECAELWPRIASKAPAVL